MDSCAKTGKWRAATVPSASRRSIAATTSRTAKTVRTRRTVQPPAPRESSSAKQTASAFRRRTAATDMRTASTALTRNLVSCVYTCAPHCIVQSFSQCSGKLNAAQKSMQVTFFYYAIQ